MCAGDHSQKACGLGQRPGPHPALEQLAMNTLDKQAVLVNINIWCSPISLPVIPWPSDAVTCLLYAKPGEHEAEIPTAMRILRDGLATGRDDSRLRHRLGLLLLKYEPENTQGIESNLKAASAENYRGYPVPLS